MIKIAALVLVTFFAVGFPCVTVVSESDTIKDLENKISEAKKEKEKTTKEINKSKETLTELNSTAKTLKGTLNELNNQLYNVSDNLTNLENSIEATEYDIKSIEEDLLEAKEIENKQYEAMKKRIKYMYESQEHDMFESILGAQSFSEFLNKTNYFEAITAYDRQMLGEYKKTCAVISEAKEYLEEERTELQSLRDAAQAEKSRVKDLVNRTNNSINDYEDEIDATEKAMRDKEEELEKQQESIKSLEKQLEEERKMTKLAHASAWRNISQVTFEEGDRKLLANIIYCEAGNQCYEAQLGVGAVVINRLLSSVYPDTVVGVVYQKSQFSPASSGRLALALSKDSATASCYAAADAAMAGQTTVGNSLYFRLPKSGVQGIRIGNIVFY